MENIKLKDKYDKLKAKQSELNIQLKTAKELLRKGQGKIELGTKHSQWRM